MKTPGWPYSWPVWKASGLQPEEAARRRYSSWQVHYSRVESRAHHLTPTKDAVMVLEEWQHWIVSPICWESKTCSRCLNVSCLPHSSLSNPPTINGGKEELQYLLQVKQQRGERKYLGSSWSLVMDSGVYRRAVNVNCACGPNEHVCSLFLWPSGGQSSQTPDLWPSY